MIINGLKIVTYLIIFVFFLFSVFFLTLKHFFPSKYEDFWIYSFFNYSIDYLTDEEKLAVFSQFDYLMLIRIEPYLFEFFKDKKDDKLLLRLIDLRHIFPIIPSGKDASDILMKLFDESMFEDMLDSGIGIERSLDKIFWFRFYRNICDYRKKS